MMFINDAIYKTYERWIAVKQGLLKGRKRMTLLLCPLSTMDRTLSDFIFGCCDCLKLAETEDHTLSRQHFTPPEHGG